MDLIEKFLRDIPRDVDGFEDIDDFWREADKINFPLPSRVRNKLFDAANLEINRRWSTYQKMQQNDAEESDDSDTDFDYDTSSSISVEIEELLLSDNEPSKDDDNDEGPMSLVNNGDVSAIENSVKSVQLSTEKTPFSQKSPDESEPSTIKANSISRINLSKETISPSGLDMSAPEFSFESARGDKSSLITNKSTTSTRSKATSALKTPQAEKVTEEGKDLPSTIRRTRNSERRVSFQDNNLPLTPLGSSGVGDASTVREDRSYDLASAGTLTPTVSQVGSPVRSFSQKTVSSILDASTPQAALNSSSLSRESIISPSAEKSTAAESVQSNKSASSKRSSRRGKGEDEEEKIDESLNRSTASSKYSKRSNNKSREESEAMEESVATSVGTRTSSKSRRSTSKAFEEEEEDGEAEPKTSTPPRPIASRKSTPSSSRSSATRSRRSLYDDEEEEEGEGVSMSQNKSASKMSIATSKTTPTSSRVSKKDSSLSPDQDLAAADYDDYPGDPGAPDDYFEEDENEKRQSISRISKSSTPSLSERSDLSPHWKEQTPKSSASKRKFSTPGSVYTEAISTPGSNEFTRGRRIPDESFHLNDSSLLKDDEDVGDSDRSTDKEELDTSAFSPSTKAKMRKEKKKKKNQSVSHNVTDGELSTTFIDQEYLETISSANKHYAGKKILEQTKQLKQQQIQKEQEKKAKQQKRKHNVIDSETEEEPNRSKYHSEGEESYDDDEEALSHGLRRSRRATKGRRFAFWKGERAKYFEGTLVDVIEVSPTPQKRRPKDQKKRKRDEGKKKDKKTVTTTDESDELESDFDVDMTNDRLIANGDQPLTKKAKKLLVKEEPEVPIELPKQYKYVPASKADALVIYDNFYEQITQESVVCSRAALPPPQPLPRTGKRPAGKNGVGAARHLFHITERPGSMPGWIAGFMDLPPQAIKDPENVGPLAQIFFINECQSDSLEFALSNPEDDEWNDKTAQRVLLTTGDSFYVPPGNMYRLENHSKTTLCKINWIIIKPLQELEVMQAASSTTSNVSQVKK